MDFLSQCLVPFIQLLILLTANSTKSRYWRTRRDTGKQLFRAASLLRFRFEVDAVRWPSAPDTYHGQICHVNIRLCNALIYNAVAGIIRS